MIVIFHVQQFTFRGTESALFDYAHYNEVLLHNKSIVVAPISTQKLNQSEIVKKFEDRFPVYFYTSFHDLVDQTSLENMCLTLKGDVLYMMKHGNLEDDVIQSIPTVFHCVFSTNSPRGIVYAGVSESVSQGKFPFVHHIVEFNNPISDEGKTFRKQLNIPDDAIVFGRHGGSDTFDLIDAKHVILGILKNDVKKRIYFLFAVRPLIFKDVNEEEFGGRLLFMNAFTDPRIKQRFIQTCDAMIHACSLGESFGISVLEFAYFNKPVITWSGGSLHKQHLTNLGEKALIYHNTVELYQFLAHLDDVKKEKDDPEFWKIRCFTPENIMKKFDEVFLAPIRNLKK